MCCVLASTTIIPLMSVVCDDKHHSRTSVVYVVMWPVSSSYQCVVLCVVTCFTIVTLCFDLCGNFDHRASVFCVMWCQVSQSYQRVVVCVGANITLMSVYCVLCGDKSYQRADVLRVVWSQVQLSLQCVLCAGKSHHRMSVWCFVMCQVNCHDCGNYHHRKHNTCARWWDLCGGNSHHRIRVLWFL